MHAHMTTTLDNCCMCEHSVTVFAGFLSLYGSYKPEQDFQINNLVLIDAVLHVVRECPSATRLVLKTFYFGQF